MVRISFCPTHTAIDEYCCTCKGTQSILPESPSFVIKSWLFYVKVQKSLDVKQAMKLQKSWTSSLRLPLLSPIYILHFRICEQSLRPCLALDQGWVLLKWPANVLGRAALTGGGPVICLGTVNSFYNWQLLFWFRRHVEMKSHELGLLLSQRFSIFGSINLRKSHYFH